MTILERKLNVISRDLNLLRSYFIGIAGRDEEGEYNPKLIKTLLSQLAQKPTYSHKSKRQMSRLLGL